MRGVVLGPSEGTSVPNPVGIPRGVEHTWQNIGAGPGRFLVVTAPAGLERFFERFAAISPDASPAEEFRRIGAETGLTVAGPPLGESDPL
jgi:hypothetical protein